MPIPDYYPTAAKDVGATCEHPAAHCSRWHWQAICDNKVDQKCKKVEPQSCSIAFSFAQSEALRKFLARSLSGSTLHRRTEDGLERTHTDSRQSKQPAAEQQLWNIQFHVTLQAVMIITAWGHRAST